MRQTVRSKTLSITIGCEAGGVFDFLASEENLPRWNRAYCKSLRKQQGQWLMESPWSTAPVRFLRDDRSGVLDQVVPLPEHASVSLALRVLPNLDGAEVVLTLFQASGIDERDYQKQLSRADQGLRDLKRLLERELSQPSAAREPDTTPSEEPSAESMAPEEENGGEAHETPLAAAEAPPVGGTRLYVGNLPYDWTDEKLRDHFAAAATVKEAEVARMGRRGRSRGFGFVEMESETDAQKAIEQLHGSTAGTRRITVRFSRPKSEESKRPARAAAGQESEGETDPFNRPEAPAPRHPRGGGGGRSRPSTPRRPQGQGSGRGGRRREPSAHVDSDEAVLETGGYYFVPRRPKTGDEAPAEGAASPPVEETTHRSRRRRR